MGTGSFPPCTGFSLSIPSFSFYFHMKSFFHSDLRTTDYIIPDYIRPVLQSLGKVSRRPCACFFFLSLSLFGEEMCEGVVDFFPFLSFLLSFPSSPTHAQKVPFGGTHGWETGVRKGKKKKKKEKTLNSLIESIDNGGGGKLRLSKPKAKSKAMQCDARTHARFPTTPTPSSVATGGRKEEDKRTEART